MRPATEANPIVIDELRQLATGRLGDMVKAVVDLRRGIVLLDADIHADQEAQLLADGSVQQDLWASTSIQTCPTPNGWSSIR